MKDITYKTREGQDLVKLSSTTFRNDYGKIITIHGDSWMPEKSGENREVAYVRAGGFGEDVQDVFRTIEVLENEEDNYYIRIKDSSTGVGSIGTLDFRTGIRVSLYRYSAPSFEINIDELETDVELITKEEFEEYSTKMVLD